MPQFTIEIDDEIWPEVEKALGRRGMNFDRWLDTMLRSLINVTSKQQVLGLSDRLRFGKYYGVILEDVIRANPGYVMWCWDTIDGFSITEEAWDLLDDVTNGGTELTRG